MCHTLAFVLDMDGVIIDSNPVHTQAWALYLQQLGLSADGIDRRMHGKRNDDIVRDFFGNGLSEKEIFDHGARKEALYRDLMRSQLRSRLVPGVVAFIQRYRHMPLAVASNAEPANIDFVLDGAGLRTHFRTVVDGHQVARPKPDPEIYLKTAQLLSLDPQDCIVFEDSMTGVEAARAAGSKVVGVDTTGASLERVDLLVHDFDDPGIDKWLSAHMKINGSRQ